jgi:hypothetical protein
VHRRREEHRGACREQRRGEEVVADLPITLAVAGATTIRSVRCPSRVCGIGSLSSKSDVCAGSDASAENVTGPTKRVASSVRTGAT